MKFLNSIWIYSILNFIVIITLSYSYIKLWEKDKEIGKKKPIFEKYFDFDHSFSDSEIIKDIEYVKKLKEWINDDEFFYKMKKGYSAKKDGFNSYDWHNKVDNKGKTLIIIQTKDNFIFGGFTSVGYTDDKSKWNEAQRNYSGGFINDSKAFIFSLRNDKNDRKPEKFPIKKGQEHYAIFSHPNNGPNFGNGPDFSLVSNLQPGNSNFGNTYNLPIGMEYDTNEAKSYLAGSYNSWEVYEIETYYI
ncbi:pep-cterm sorting domain-containing protein [Anaeramoeba ignava]|uniref:Pep-cterm sorting domain-containing protein n=1 Tax=Anaeramoeba ignava TaxID=1746090 RepID=A0A9Q0REI5_ANAIG|nr:pep-cterm sorting domain-containing protein [Anaeramoeba ignava]